MTVAIKSNKRHQFQRRHSTDLKSFIKNNYSKPAFDRMRDQLGIKSAELETRQLWCLLYQASINRLANGAMLIAECQRKKTVTSKMVCDAYDSLLNSNRSRLYTLEERRTDKSKRNTTKLETKETTQDVSDKEE